MTRSFRTSIASPWAETTSPRSSRLSNSANVMMCLEKNPNLRYQSSEQLGHRP